MSHTADDWFSPETSTFGDRVAGARESAGMTQAQLSKRLGVKLTTLRGWEEDLSEPRANKLQMLSGVLNVSLMWLLNGEGDGVDAPVDEVALPDDLNALLIEIRQLKTQIANSADRLGLIEKRLRMSFRANQ
ncbi:helix-turn-helix domain-containing protein [Parasulfitobacter algicola]|uniref:Helix-turn-helix domain-containing protein n=1 Tax=Parasulfitobacter algicola TaxID=2614809 RepID=A0ABX2ITA6_9RHOB|nr:helix-turn-helix domain-containing protein [Sulfitobacter algicola]NSX54310.1 helix-turn-helix domain-containing protein [Sulfitobacter algicola]